jgi:hypothetical protein
VSKKVKLALGVLFVRATAVFATLLAALLTIAPEAQAATTTTIDFSKVSQGPFDQSFFARDRVVFTQGTFVGFVQGDNALVGPVAGKVSGGFKSLSAQVAPALQGTAAYTLTAYKQGKEITSTTITVTQDEGDPTTGPFGYFTVSIGPLPKKADSFSLSNEFIRSSFPQNNSIEFGVSSITFSR